MSTLKKIIKKLAIRVFAKINLWNKSQCIKVLAPDSKIHESLRATGVVLKGNINIEENVQLDDSEIRGKIHIGKHSVIRNCRLIGDISIDAYAKLSGPIIINGASKITIGKNTSLNGPNLDIRSHLNEVKIGNFCSIARNTSFQEFNHLYQRATSYLIHQNVFGEPLEKDIYSRGNIEVGHDVWIGAGCIILSGAKIGNGAIIAANSVVAKEIPSYTIAGGSPAKVIRYRFSQDIIDKLLEVKWWYWSHEQLKQNKHLFEGELTISKLNAIHSQ